MEITAVFKLKASLSEFLLKVKAGEEVIITDRGKPVANQDCGSFFSEKSISILFITGCGVNVALLL